eukprot:14553965-Ditylum_brightwellii.AAC.1
MDGLRCPPHNPFIIFGHRDFKKSRHLFNQGVIKAGLPPQQRLVMASLHQTSGNMAGERGHLMWIHRGPGGRSMQREIIRDIIRIVGIGTGCN